MNDNHDANQILTARDEAIAHRQLQGNSPPRIFVVEDESDIRRLNIEVLTRSGYQVDTVGDGAAAYAAFSADCGDLMITDNHRPR